MSVQLFYTSIIAFFVGVGCMSIVSVPYELLLLCSLLAWIVVLSRRGVFRVLLSVALICFVVGAIRFDSATWQFTNATPPEGVITLSGKVATAPERRDATTHVSIEVIDENNEQVGIRVLLYAPRTTTVSYGQIVSVTGELVQPEAFTTELGRTFNYPDFLRARDVSYVMFRPEIVVRESNQGNALVEVLLSFKSAFITSINAVIPEPQAGLAAGLLLGERGGLGETLEEQFRRAGVIHIVVLSGYNVMLVVLFVMSMMSYFFKPKGRLIAGLIAIVCFALMVGLSATVVRASIMAALLLIAQTTKRHYAVLRALFVAGALMVLSNPYLLLYDPGFQLSFLATLGLLVLSPWLEGTVRMVPETFGIRSFIVATIATQLWVLPFLLYQIGEVSVVALIVNVLVLPVVPVAMLLTFITGMIGLLVPSVGLVFGYCTYMVLSYIIGVATWFGSLSFASYAVPPFSVWVMAAMYAMFALVWFVYRQHHSNPLHGWTIESDVKYKSAASNDAAPETPIFFR